MAGIHIAEALKIPYFRAFTMTWTRTRAYPHAFAVPEHKVGETSLHEAGAHDNFSRWVVGITIWFVEAVFVHHLD